MMLRSIMRTLRSPKFTVALIVCLSVIFLLGLTVPQKKLLGYDAYMMWRVERPALVSFLEYFKLTSIYTSPVTIAVWGLFFLNLIAVMMDRIPAIWRRSTDAAIPDSVASVQAGRQYEALEGADPGQALSALDGMGYRLFSAGSSFRAVKNRFSPLATILFHLSFFLLLAGGVTSFYTKFSAEAVLGVGETFTGQYQKVTRPKVGGVPRTTFTVTDIKPSYRMGAPIGLAVTLDTPEGRRTAEINKPYNVGALSFVIRDIDVAPLFVVTAGAGWEIDGAYVKLRVMNGQEDTFSLAGYDVAAIFYTDAGSIGKETGGAYNLPQALMQSTEATTARPQPEIRDPAFNLSVFKDRKLLAVKTVRPGESVKLKNGQALRFAELRYWVKFRAVREYGLGLVYAGIIIMTFALAVRFLLFRRDIRGVVENGVLHIGGRAEFFEALFEEEFKQMLVSVKGDAGAERPERVRRNTPSP